MIACVCVLVFAVALRLARSVGRNPQARYKASRRPSG